MNGAFIKTFEHDLTIIAEEFVSNHSIIQNFPEGQWAKKDQEGKHGGDILIETEIAKGKLQLFLNGENGGHVPRGKYLSKEERDRLKGRDGKDGKNAFYKIRCRALKHTSKVSGTKKFSKFQV